MANDVIQMPFRISEFNPDMVIAIEKNFREIERLLGILQIYMNKTGYDMDNRSGNINPDGTFPTSKLDDKMIGLEHELQLVDEAVTEAKLAVRAVTDAKIADHAIMLSKFAEGLRPVQLVTELPELPDDNYPQGAVVILVSEATMYRSTGTEWSKSVSAADITGEITETQITDGAISTPKLAANAVTANELAANAVIASKILAGAVEAAKIAAGAVTADKIAANAVTTEKILADAVTASKIYVETLSAITANLGTITAGRLESGVVISNEVIVGDVPAGDIPSNEDIQDKINDHNDNQSPHNLPSYCKMQSDGFKVLDASNILRCHLGQYEPGQYGLRIVDGKIEANGILYDKTAFVTSAILDGFGDGSEGDFNSTGNVILPVDTEDASSVIKQYKSFTLNAWHTLTTKKRCRGLFIFCQGDVTINGTINMNGKAGKISKTESAQRILQIPVGVYTLEVPSGGTAGDGGAGGHGGGSSSYYGAGGAKGAGTNGTWFGGGIGGAGGGGGGGQCREPSDYDVFDGGDAGSSDLDLAIGPGGIGSISVVGNYTAPTDGGNFSGGGGGSSQYTGKYTKGLCGGGGAGVNGGTGGNPGSSQNGAGGGGFGGGLVCIVAKGNIKIGSAGRIYANGLNGGKGGDGAGDGINTPGGGGGGQGGGGGGVVVLAYKGTYSNRGSITVNGGYFGMGGAAGVPGGYSGAATSGQNGESGAVGTIVLAKV